MKVLQLCERQHTTFVSGNKGAPLDPMRLYLACGMVRRLNLLPGSSNLFEGRMHPSVCLFVPERVHCALRCMRQEHVLTASHEAGAHELTIPCDWQQGHTLEVQLFLDYDLAWCCYVYARLQRNVAPHIAAPAHPLLMF
jgi:hypothetical protein